MTPTNAQTVPARDDAVIEAGGTAGLGALAAGASHVLFAVAGVVLGTATVAIQNDDYAASLVADYRWFGLASSILTMLWAACYLFGMLAVGRLVWQSGSLAAAFANAGAVIFAGLVALTSGLALSLYSGGTTDLIETRADIATQQAVMQGVWIVLHGAWYGACWIMASWLTGLAVGARRAGVFQTLGFVLTLVAALSVVAIVVLQPYPTALPFASLYFLVLGIVLLVRAVRRRRMAAADLTA